MPITHTTIPVPPAQVGETEWAEAHTLPTADEIGALTTASADARYVLGSAGGFLTPDSASTIYLLKQDASTVYARQVSAVTTAQLVPYITSDSVSAIYLLKQDASTTYARQASAVTTAQLVPYITSDSVSAIYLLKQDASTTYARQVSAVTTAQLASYITSDSVSTIYLLKQDASTTYARQASAVTTAQLAIYLLADTASTTYARQVSAVTTAQLGSYLTSASASAAYASIGAITSVVNVTEASADSKYGKFYLMTADVTTSSNSTVTTIAELIASVSGSTAYRIEGALVYRAQTTTTQNIGILCSVTPTPGTFMFGADIYGQGADGTAAVFSGYASANGDIIIGTSSNILNVDLPLLFTGTIVTGAVGQIQIAFRSEITNTGVVMRRGSSMRVTRLGAM